MTDDAWAREDLPRLALAFYAASAGEGFAEALEACREALGADIAFCCLAATATSARRDHHLGGAITPESLDEDTAHWARLSARRRVWVEVPDGHVVDFTRVVPAEAFARTAVWRGFLRRRIPMLHGVGLAVTLGAGLQARLGLGRRPERGPFPAATRARLAALAPHLRRAARARVRLVAADAVGPRPGTVFDRLDLAVARYGRDGRFEAANAPLRRLVARRDGLGLGPNGLEPARPGDRAALADAIREGATARLPLARPAHPVPYIADVVATEGASPRVFVVVSDPAADAPVEAAGLAALFGLSAAQARLVQDIAAGLPLPAHAKAAGIPLETARSRLKAVLARTGCRRRVDLAALIARLPRLRATP